AVDVRRREERQALDVIPVHVREQHVVLAGLAARLAHELVAERAQTGAGIDDQRLAGGGAGLDARRLAAVAHGPSAGHRVTAPDPPESDLHRPGEFYALP